ncbi:unnamed protein product, partial [Gulo gulo]
QQGWRRRGRDRSQRRGLSPTVRGLYYLVCQLSPQPSRLLRAALLLQAQRRLLLACQALGGLQVCLPLPHGAAQRRLLRAQRVQPRAQLR